MANKQSKIKSENIKLKAENVKLKQSFEEHEYRFIKLEQNNKDTASENVKLKARIAKLEQKQSQTDEKNNFIVKSDDDAKGIDQSSVNTISTKMKNSNDTLASNISDNTSNFDDVSNFDICQKSENQHLTSPILIEPKLSEDIEIDDFLDSTYKEKVSKERIREKILQQNLSSDNTSLGEVISKVSVPSTLIFRNTKLGKSEISAEGLCQNTHRKKGAENIVQMIADGIKNDAQSSDKATPCDVISIESLNQNLSTDSLISLAQLFDKADDAEYNAIHANQEEASAIVQDGKGKIGEKKAKKIIYNKMLEHLFMLQKQRSEETGLRLPEISYKNLQRKTQKAVKIYKLFEKISELITPIPITHGSNSLGNSSFMPQIALAEVENHDNYNEVYYDDEACFDDSTPQLEKGTNEVLIVDNSDYSHDNNSEEERLDELDDDEYNEYNIYDEYSGYDRGYYYHDRRYERKSSLMMSSIISPVTA
ncbi:14834_t:CDS:2 [Cetraspora pellucida]|uniref:14834_t:CDS:1 n=1 Tax=Cetraspora pellucida TaxID=1433469 RepID=A0ACA9N249_9GLOM|nr:14834_t:CDS:2 [Cetraspora pellucida]